MRRIYVIFALMLSLSAYCATDKRGCAEGCGQCHAQDSKTSRAMLELESDVLPTHREHPREMKDILGEHADMPELFAFYFEPQSLQLNLTHLTNEAQRNSLLRFMSERVSDCSITNYNIYVMSYCGTFDNISDQHRTEHSAAMCDIVQSGVRSRLKGIDSSPVSFSSSAGSPALERDVVYIIFSPITMTADQRARLIAKTVVNPLQKVVSAR